MKVMASTVHKPLDKLVFGRENMALRCMIEEIMEVSNLLAKLQPGFEQLARTYVVLLKMNRQLLKKLLDQNITDFMLPFHGEHKFARVLSEWCGPSYWPRFEKQ